MSVFIPQAPTSMEQIGPDVGKRQTSMMFLQAVAFKIAILVSRFLAFSLFANLICCLWGFYNVQSCSAWRGLAVCVGMAPLTR